MQSKASNVETYLADVPPDRRACLIRLRDLCLATLSGYEEGMDYGMPCYKKGGTPEVAFASQKSYISLYIMKKAVVDAHRDALQSASIGKGCIRFSKPEKIDFAVVEKMLSETASSHEEAC